MAQTKNINGINYEVVDATAPTTSNAIAAQQQRTTASEEAPATAANAGMQAASDTIAAAASPTASGGINTSKTSAIQSAATNGAAYGQATSANMPSVSAPRTGNEAADTLVNKFQAYVAEQAKAQAAQAQLQTDYSTQKSIDELQRTEADAAAEYDKQRAQINIDEAKAKDNAVLYAEARGDKGGIGQAQYTNIALSAAQNRLAVNQAQTKLSTDTARQIADLRAQGEFEKADAVLTITQSYLSSISSMYQWAVEFGFSREQFQTELEQWEKSYALEYASLMGYLPDGTATYDTQRDLASMGVALLEAGIVPSAEQLKALNMTKAEAEAYIKSSAGTSTTTSKETPTATDVGSPSETTYSTNYELLLGAIANTKSSASGKDYKTQTEVYNTNLKYINEALNEGAISEAEAKQLKRAAAPTRSAR